MLPVLFASCSDDNEEPDEYENWEVRNDAYFNHIRQLAQDSIRQAKNAHGDRWRDYSNWMAFLSYSLDSTIVNESTDSIYVQVLKRGSGPGCPLSSDSCRIFYRGRLIPSESYPEGYVFAHSGQSSKFEEIFNANTSVPTIMRPSTAVKGFGTAMQNMHVGDRWRVYIPAELAYGSTSTSAIPAHSTLIFELELLAYYRKGTGVPSWN